MFVENAEMPCFAAPFSEPIEPQDSFEALDFVVSCSESMAEVASVDSFALEQFACDRFGAFHVLSESEMLALDF